jgi:tripartite-type tricarboxylate transporter receptor subunit TctC
LWKADPPSKKIRADIKPNNTDRETHAQKTTMRRVCFLLPSILCVAFTTAEAKSQAWPMKPMRAIVSFPAGGAVDIVARVVLDQFSVQLRQPVVV